MHEEISSVFFSSYDRILSESGLRFFEDFYRTFLSSSPEIAEKFKNTDMQRQKTVLKQSFYQLLYFFNRNRKNDYIQNLADVHSKKSMNITPEMYDLWLDCLVDTVRKHDVEFTVAVEEAWRAVFIPGIEFMKSGGR